MSGVRHFCDVCTRPASIDYQLICLVGGPGRERNSERIVPSYKLKKNLDKIAPSYENKIKTDKKPSED